MTQKEIEEGNTLIAKFMGKETTPYPFDTKRENTQHWNSPVWTFEETGIGRYKNPYDPHLEWGRLMPVIEKIGASDFCSYSINSTQCIIRYEERDATGLRIVNGKEVSIYNNDKKKTLETVWLAVVEFIKWYNSQLINPHPTMTEEEPIKSIAKRALVDSFAQFWHAFVSSIIPIAFIATTYHRSGFEDACIGGILFIIFSIYSAQYRKP